MSNHRVLIIGGGVIGLSIGWTLAREDVPVTLFERGQPGRKASWASAGMLAPDAELQFEEPELHRLNRESLRRWPDFVDTLEASGFTIDNPVAQGTCACGHSFH
jgi:glycine oxidase